MPPVDRAALTDAVRALARISADHPDITEIDVNPLIVEGSTPVAADALAILDPAAGRHPAAPCTTTSSLVFLESRGRVLAERGSGALSSAADAGGVRPGHLAMNKHQHWGNVNGPSFLDVRDVLYTEHVFDILSMPGVDP